MACHCQARVNITAKAEVVPGFVLATSSQEWKSASQQATSKLQADLRLTGNSSVVSLGRRRVPGDVKLGCSRCSIGPSQLGLHPRMFRPPLMLLVFGGHGSCVRAIHAGARGSSIPPVDLPSVQSARWSSSRTRFGPPFHASQLRQVGHSGHASCISVSPHHVPSHGSTGAGGLLTKRSDTRLRTPCRLWFS